MRLMDIRRTASSIVLLLAACSSTPERPEPQTFLATQILNDGSKQFVYTVEFPESQRRGRGSKGQGRPGNATGHVYGNSSRGVGGGVTMGSAGGRSGRTPSQLRQSEEMVALLEQELDESGFCRHGFIELERSVEPAQTFIRGECDEAATVEDRKAFPNS